MKTKVILHGGFTKKENDLNQSFFENFFQDIPVGGTILIVLFASRADSPQEHFENILQIFGRYQSDKKFNFVLGDEEQFIEQLKTADAIYIQGGSTNKLLKTLREYDLEEIKDALRGKSVAGSSAGAYALAAFGSAHNQEEVRPGLGIALVRVVCHHESPELPPYGDAVSLLEKTNTELPIIYLKDCEWEILEFDL